MEVNSFGRKIKNNFSITFKKDEEEMKLWLNEQIVPSAYLKKLILDDMQKKESEPVSKKDNNEVANESESNFDFDF